MSYFLFNNNIVLCFAMSGFFFDKIFAKTETKIFAKLRKNFKTEIYEISRHQKLRILDKKSPILREFSRIHMKFFDFMG